MELWKCSHPKCLSHRISWPYSSARRQRSSLVLERSGVLDWWRLPVSSGAVHRRFECVKGFSSHESCATGCHSFHTFFGLTFLTTSGSRQALYPARHTSLLDSRKTLGFGGLSKDVHTNLRQPSLQASLAAGLHGKLCENLVLDTSPRPTFAGLYVIYRGTLTTSAMAFPRTNCRTTTVLTACESATLSLRAWLCFSS